MEFNNFYDIVNQLPICNWPNEVKNMLLIANELVSEQEKRDFYNWFKNVEWSDMNNLDSTSKPGDHFEEFEGWTWDMLNPTIPVKVICNNNKFNFFDKGVLDFSSEKYKIAYWQVHVNITLARKYAYIVLPSTKLINGNLHLTNFVLRIDIEDYIKYKYWIQFTSNRGELCIEDGYLCNSYFNR